MTHKHGGQSIAHVAGRARFKPFLDRRVQNSTVVCASCGAQVGEKCRTKSGAYTIHPVRRRDALRKERDE